MKYLIVVVLVKRKDYTFTYILLYHFKLSKDIDKITKF